MSKVNPKATCPECGREHGVSKDGLMVMHRGTKQTNVRLSAGDNFYNRGLNRTQCRGVGKPGIIVARP